MMFIILLCLYGALVFFGVAHHEPWRDEAHVWMAARENSLRVIIDDFKYDRTPGLWTMILIPFAKSGFPYPLTMQLIHVSFAILAIGLLFFFSNIPLLIKILFAFSYYMVYEYAVIARHYVLTVVLLFAIAAIYPKRFAKPLLFALFVVLLFQTNSVSIVSAAVLGFFFGIEMITQKKVSLRRILAFIIMALAGLVTIAILFPDRSMPYALSRPKFLLVDFTKTIREAIVPTFDPYGAGFFQSPTFNHIAIILTSICLFSFMVLIWRKRSLAFMAVVMLGWIVFFSTFMHSGSGRHHAMLLIYVLFFWWVCGGFASTSSSLQLLMRGVFYASLGILLFISVSYFTVRIYTLDYMYDFSGGKDMAAYITSNGLEKLEIAAYSGGIAESVLPYLRDTYFWYPEFAEKGYFNTADIRYLIRRKNLTSADAIDRIQKRFPPDTPALFLSSCFLASPERLGYTLLHVSSADRLSSENFLLYANAAVDVKRLTTHTEQEYPRGDSCIF